MWTLLFLMSSLAPGGAEDVIKVTGFVGQSVEIKCPYESQYKTYIKYLCRGTCPYGYRKNIPVRSRSAVEDERFSLYDDTAARVFTITIADLRSGDAGQYWCGIQRKMLRDIYTEIELWVLMDRSRNKSLFTKITVRPDKGSVLTSDTNTDKPSVKTKNDQSECAIWIAVAGGHILLIVSIITILCLCREYKKQKRNMKTDDCQVNDYRSADQTRCTSDDTYTALDPVTISPAYDGLQVVRSVAV